MKMIFQGGASVPASRGQSSQTAARGDARPTKSILPFLAALILFFAAGAAAQTTNGLSAAEIQGRKLAWQLLEQQPVTNFTQEGILRIRDAKKTTTDVPIRFQAMVSATDWQTTYKTTTGSNQVELIVNHALANRIVIIFGKGFRDLAQRWIAKQWPCPVQTQRFHSPIQIFGYAILAWNFSTGRGRKFCAATRRAGGCARFWKAPIPIRPRTAIRACCRGLTTRRSAS